MENKKIGFVLVVLFLLSVTVKTHAQKETRNVAEFTKISFATSGNLYLKQGNTQSVVLEGDDLDEYKTEVSGGRLKIGRKSNNWSWNNRKIDVYITIKKLEGLSVSGSGEVHGQTKVTTDELDLSVSGSGDIELDVDVDEIETGISGSGKVKLSGNVGYHSVSISGSGKISAEDLEAESYKIKISGSGSCRINVSKEIEASVSGSGSIYYTGNPDRVNSHSSGSGRIKKI